MGSYECDDGNLIDGDGCDHNCLKEHNAICRSNNNSISTCILPSYSIDFIEGMYKVNINFNFPVANVSDYLQNMKIKIKKASGQIVEVPILSVDALDSSTFQMCLFLDNITTSSGDSFMVDCPGIPTNEGGSENIGTSVLQTQTLGIAPENNAIGAKVLM